MNIYISGPITGRPNLNLPKFVIARYEIFDAGHTYVCPHMICAHIKPGSPWIDYMAVCLGELPKCDAIYMLPGWIWSRGARIEWIVAKLLGIKRWKP